MNNFKLINYYYETRLKKDLIEKYNYTSEQNIPKIKNIHLNVGFKNALLNKKNLVPVILSLELITGQTPVVTHAKLSVATFKLKKNMPIGCKVKLGNYKGDLFLLKLITVVLPNIKEFMGFSGKNFDGKGNFAFGLEDFSLFTEISLIYDKFEISSGMDVVITTTAKSNKEAKILLSGFNFPFIN